MKGTAYILFILLLTLIFNLLLAGQLFAIPEYSESTGEGCRTCHLDEEGRLSKAGLEYSASGYRWPPSGGFRVLGPIRKPLRFFIGVLHMTAAFLWFGTILYVHILLRPGYASKGLPKGEVLLGIVSMAVVGITGILLTVSKVRGLDVFYQSRWGMLLLTKIILYVIMVSSAMFVVIFIGPRLKKGMKKAEAPKGGVFDPLTLSGFDGKEGRPAYISFKGNVYDVTGLRFWKNGIHMKHLSGEDLTDAITKAPHGEEKLNGLMSIGLYNETVKPSLNPSQKAFYFIAYMNLAIVFLVLFVIALFRWGI